MQKIESTILGPNQERLLVLTQWIENNSNDCPIDELVHRCIEEKIRKRTPKINPNLFEEAVSEKLHELLFQSPPFCELQYSYGDWWSSILEDWLQDGWATLFGQSTENEIWIEGFIETMDLTRLNKDIIYADEPTERDRQLVTDFLLEWRRRAFSALTKFLNDQ